MKAKFTPGPWRTACSPGYIIVDNGSKPSTVIAHAWSIDIHVPDEWKANARLIAAAPKLYEALNKAKQLASIATDWNLTEVEIDGEMVSVYDLLREFKAALALADGDGGE